LRAKLGPLFEDLLSLSLSNIGQLEILGHW
jgi:hypothetical protein